jgi:hypothetical protein
MDLAEISDNPPIRLISGCVSDVRRDDADFHLARIELGETQRVKVKITSPKRHENSSLRGITRAG